VSWGRSKTVGVFFTRQAGGEQEGARRATGCSPPAWRHPLTTT